tara:strand:+ start:1070 stop:1846 length:777 start_codon:yes stop_codon:yes gene_type:complete
MFLLNTNTNQNNMFTFSQYLTTCVEATDKELDIKDLEKMIKNPDRKRVKSYGGTKYVDMLKSKLAKLKESVDLEEGKIPSSNIAKFSSPQAAKRAASKQKYITQVFMGDDDKFWVPSTNKEAGQLKKDGYEVYESTDLEEAVISRKLDIDINTGTFSSAQKKTLTAIASSLPGKITDSTTSALKGGGSLGIELDKKVTIYVHLSKQSQVAEISLILPSPANARDKKYKEFSNITNSASQKKLVAYTKELLTFKSESTN